MIRKLLGHSNINHIFILTRIKTNVLNGMLDCTIVIIKKVVRLKLLKYKYDLYNKP